MLRSLRWTMTEAAARWARKRQGTDAAEVQLHHRRIYILPTPLGLVFGLLWFAMLLAAMNYNNNMGFALTFLLAGQSLVAMHQCHWNLLGLKLNYLGCDPVFAGHYAHVRIKLDNPSRTARLGLCLHCGDYVSAPVDLNPGEAATAVLVFPAPRRGWLPLPRYSVRTRFPFGLFQAWAWLHMDIRCMVYPRPAADHRRPPPLPFAQAGTASRGEKTGQEDFDGLRVYRPGDSPRHIAWPAFAREQGLLVKQFTGAAAPFQWFDWESLEEPDIEARLSRLCRWILEAEESRQPYGLKLPGTRLEPDSGLQHQARCLQSLALFPERDSWGILPRLGD